MPSEIVEKTLLFEKYLKKIQPIKEDVNKLNNLFFEIKKYISLKYNINAELMGSVAKNTFLKDNNDLDIFIFFDLNTSEKQVEKKALLIGKNVFNHFNGTFIIDYASHPYTKGIIKNCKVEIVPCYKINSISQMKSAVDRTPFHTQFVLKNINESQRKQVLLLKQFLKTINCYGSDLKTKGFSGYLCELLIIKYKTFENTLKELCNLKKNSVISIFETKTNTEKIIEEFKSPLVFLDPVDKKRNVAASLGYECLLKTKHYAIKFLSNPEEIYFDKKTFEKKSVTIRTLKSFLKNHYFYFICFEKPDIIDDILYPQLERFKKSIEKYIIKNDFSLNYCFFDVCKISHLCIIGFDFKTNKLSCFNHRRGPDLFTKNEKVQEFLKKHKNIYFRDKYYVCVEKRKITSAFDLIKSIGKIKIQKQLAISRQIRKKLRKTFFALDISELQYAINKKKIPKNIICRNLSIYNSKKYEPVR